MLFSEKITKAKKMRLGAALRTIGQEYMENAEINRNFFREMSSRGGIRPYDGKWDPGDTGLDDNWRRALLEYRNRVRIEDPERTKDQWKRGQNSKGEYDDPFGIWMPKKEAEKEIRSIDDNVEFFIKAMPIFEKWADESNLDADNIISFHNVLQMPGDWILPEKDLMDALVKGDPAGRDQYWQEMFEENDHDYIDEDEPRIGREIGNNEWMEGGDNPEEQHMHATGVSISELDPKVIHEIQLPVLQRAADDLKKELGITRENNSQWGKKVSILSTPLKKETKIIGGKEKEKLVPVSKTMTKTFEKFLRADGSVYTETGGDMAIEMVYDALFSENLTNLNNPIEDIKKAVAIVSESIANKKTNLMNRIDIENAIKGYFDTEKKDVRKTQYNRSKAISKMLGSTSDGRLNSGDHMSLILNLERFVGYLDNGSFNPVTKKGKAFSEKKLLDAIKKEKRILGEIMKKEFIARLTGYRMIKKDSTLSKETRETKHQKFKKALLYLLEKKKNNGLEGIGLTDEDIKDIYNASEAFETDSLDISFMDASEEKSVDLDEVSKMYEADEQ